MELQEKKRLRLLVLTDYTVYGDAAVAHAAAMSLIFRAELLIIPLSDKETPYGERFTNTLQVLNKQCLPVIHYTKGLNLKKELYSFIEEYEIMMLVLSVSPRKESFFSYHSALRLIKKMRVPVLAVGKTLPQADAYQKIILPLDYLIYAKEKSLWAAYFNQFYKSDIYILSKKYKDEYLQYKLYENVSFTKQLYENLSVTYYLRDVEISTENIDDYARTFARQTGASLIISMTTKFLEIGDILTGTKEKKTIKHVDEISYLYINQRDDLYVICT
ncbi:MAG: hypothetical protein LBG80_12760 [Bacteroidales bacterium]|jgi:hypothetical protein|nr:hypothetical protein [Bacteroidales bacterium]